MTILQIKRKTPAFSLRFFFFEKSIYRSLGSSRRVLVLSPFFMCWPAQAGSGLFSRARSPLLFWGWEDLRGAALRLRGGALVAAGHHRPRLRQRPQQPRPAAALDRSHLVGWVGVVFWGLVVGGGCGWFLGGASGLLWGWVWGGVGVHT